MRFAAALSIVIALSIWPISGAGAALNHAELGQQAVGVLVKHRQDSDAEVRAAVAAAWGEVGNHAALPWLQKALSDKNSGVRLEAAYSLHRLGDERGLPALMAIVRQSSASAENLSAAEEMRLLAKNKSRVMSIQKLSRIGGEDAVNLFEKTLKDPSGAVRDATSIALAKMGLDEFETPFIEALRDLDDSVRVAAVKALGEIGTPAALEALHQAAGDPAVSVRAEVMRALGEFSDAETARALAKATADGDLRVRSRALGALAKIRDIGTTNLLRAIMKDSNAVEIQLKAMAGLALRGDIDYVDLPLAAACLKQKDADLKALALDVLRKVDNDASSDILSRVMQDDPDARVRVQAAAILVKRLQNSVKKT